MFARDFERNRQTIHVKIGAHEFKAKGPTSVILIQYNAWLSRLPHSPIYEEVNNNTIDSDEETEKIPIWASTDDGDD